MVVLTLHNGGAPGPTIQNGEELLTFTRDKNKRQSFHFQKSPGGGLNINIFCTNWHGASFYIKEQANKKKLKHEF